MSREVDIMMLYGAPLLSAKALQAGGSIKTRVFVMSQLQEAVEWRSESRRHANDTVTTVIFLSVRLDAIDSRIINYNGSIFSATLKDNEKLKQLMQFGSDALSMVANAVPQRKERLNEKFLLKGLGRHGIYTVKSF